jgi:hypothetical protein
MHCHAVPVTVPVHSAHDTCPVSLHMQAERPCAALHASFAPICARILAAAVAPAPTSSQSLSYTRNYLRGGTATSMAPAANAAALGSLAELPRPPDTARPRARMRAFSPGVSLRPNSASLMLIAVMATSASGCESRTTGPRRQARLAGSQSACCCTGPHAVLTTPEPQRQTPGDATLCPQGVARPARRRSPCQRRAGRQGTRGSRPPSSASRGTRRAGTHTNSATSAPPLPHSAHRPCWRRSPTAHRPAQGRSIRGSR